MEKYYIAKDDKWSELSEDNLNGLQVGEMLAILSTIWPLNPLDYPIISSNKSVLIERGRNKYELLIIHQHSPTQHYRIVGILQYNHILDEAFLVTYGIDSDRYSGKKHSLCQSPAADANQSILTVGENFSRSAISTRHVTYELKAFMDGLDAVELYG